MKYVHGCSRGEWWRPKIPMSSYNASPRDMPPPCVRFMASMFDSQFGMKNTIRRWWCGHPVYIYDGWMWMRMDEWTHHTVDWFMVMWPRWRHLVVCSFPDPPRTQQQQQRRELTHQIARVISQNAINPMDIDTQSSSEPSIRDIRWSPTWNYDVIIYSLYGGHARLTWAKGAKRQFRNLFFCIFWKFDLFGEVESGISIADWM